MASDIIDRVCDLSPTISKRAAEIEEQGRIPADLIADLIDTGCFRMLLPREYGGEGASLVHALKVIEQLSLADGSTGWSVMISTSNTIVLGLFPRDTFLSIHHNRPDIICSGSHAPFGKARLDPDGGIRISGRWPLVSACTFADWVVVNAAVIEGDMRRTSEGGRPDMRLALLPASDVQIVDTWKALGLRGTGSHDVLINNVYCPPERVCSLFGGSPTVEGSLFSVPTIAPLGLFIAAVALGIAQGLLDDLIRLALRGKQAAYSAKLVREMPLFQATLGEVDTRLRAARALVHGEATAAWETSLSKGTFSLLDRARMRAASSHAVPVALEVGGEAFRLCGSAALVEGSSMERRMRDLRTLAQHTGVGPEFFTTAGALLVQAPVENIRF